MTIRGVAVLLLCTLPAAVCAQALTDPTRPPLGIGAGDGMGAGVQQIAPPATKGLLSVIISPSRCAAIIDGRTIRLGEKYGDATLVEITPQGVVLRSEHGRRTMQLFPGVGMKSAAAPVAPQPAVICRLDSRKQDKQETPKKSTRHNGLKEKK